MKKQHLLILFFSLIAAVSKANPGDTTWVQAHNDKWLDYYNNFDTTVQFPNGTTSYRKVYMIFTLGKYVCPGNPQYCGSWDYTVQNYLMTPGGDTVELSRLITPYATTGGRFSNSWKYRYIFDVTDYYPILKNTGTIRIHYSGYSGGFTANIKFAFVEGTPERDVKGISRVWNGSFAFGKASDPFDNHTPAMSKTAPAGTQSADLKFNVTGHGSDAQYCSEFCSKYYKVMLNSNLIDQKNIWRDNCGFNQIYPQTGTWIYDRANWCPGALVNTNTHHLTGVTAGSNYNVDVDFEQYTDNGNASYTIDGAVIYYGGYNRTVDASLESIVAPTDYEGNMRENPVCSVPSLKIHNAGSTTITSVKIEYGVQGSFLPQYTWTGSLPALQDTVINLPESWSLRTATGTNTFVARILAVNNQTDQDSTNNTQKTSFVAAPVWPVTFSVNMKANTFAAANETTWKIYDMNNNIVAQRSNTSSNATYIDTLVLGPSCYKLVVEDQGCDGLSWWANSGAGSGYLQVKKLGNPIPLTLGGYYSGDFGCGFTQYFTTSFATGVETINGAENMAAITAYPNPARDNVTINITGVQGVEGTLQLVDALGRTVLEQQINTAEQTINTSSLANGIYTIVFRDAHAAGTKLQTRLVIAR